MYVRILLAYVEFCYEKVTLDEQTRWERHVGATKVSPRVSPRVIRKGWVGGGDSN